MACASVRGSVTINNATITENMTDGVGGGIVNDPGATVDVQNTIVASNEASGSDNDVSGVFISLGTNFIGDTGTSAGFVNGQAGDQAGTTVGPFDAVLGALANNGGPTRTHALLTGSPAIDAGNNAGGVPLDQVQAVDGKKKAVTTEVFDAKELGQPAAGSQFE